MKRRLSRLTRAMSLLLFIFVYLFSLGGTVFGLSAEQKRVIDSNARYFDVEVGCASAPANGKLYIVGDSLTVGMRDSGSLVEKFEAKGWANVTVQATNGDNISDAIPKVTADQAAITDASTAVIALGTNRDPNFAAQIPVLVNKLREYNPEIKIFWVNVYTEPGAYIDGGQAEDQRVNQAINDAENDLSFSVIRWKAEVTSNPDQYPFLGDGVHHTPEGYQAKVAYLAEEVGVPPAALPGASSQAGSDNTNLVGDTNEEKIFNYLLGKEVHGKALTDYMVAGILGNMWAESGYQPQRLQGTPSGTITTAEQAREKSLGWGLVQWTPPGKMINPVMASGKDPNNIAIQLDFLLAQLNGTDIDGQAGQLLVQTTDVGAATVTFETKYERHAGPPQPDRIVEAQRILDQGFSGGGGNGDGCGGGGDSDLTSKVLEYAWETYHPAPYTTAKQEYSTAIAAAQRDGQYVGGNSRPGIDCGGFVTRLMIDSGFEPNYNFSGKTADGAGNVSSGQIRWLEQNWEKITVNGSQDLRPGDVAVNSGRTHTYVYVGTIPGFEKTIASASLGSGPNGSWRAPMAGAESVTGSNIDWYRQR